MFDRQSEDESNTELGLDLSERFNFPVFAVINRDDDVLVYQLFERASPVDEYCSCPAFFDPAEPESPAGGDVNRLCTAFGSTNLSEVDSILRRPSDECGYVFAVAIAREHIPSIKLAGELGRSVKL